MKVKLLNLVNPVISRNMNDIRYFQGETRNLKRERVAPEFGTYL